jgi:hypothetical protein
MATYASYKKVDGSSLADGSITEDRISLNAFATWNVKWIFGEPCFCSTGCCCLWTVPSGVRKVFFELWGAGGNGHGACSTSRCQHYAGAGGGYYNSKMIDTAPGCQYTICAAGVFPCLTNECVGCIGCSSYVTGFNLSNFCAIGGIGGCANASWNEACFSDFSCCLGPVSNGGDFGMGNHRGAFHVHQSQCHCQCRGETPTPAPFIGTQVHQGIQDCWFRCGCWTVPYGHGGQGGMTTYCGGSNCCAQGGTGGPGLVKISFL